jgi:hypothetical protein
MPKRHQQATMRIITPNINQETHYLPMMLRGLKT